MSVFKSKNKERFVKIYENYADEIYNFVYVRVCLDKSVAEDMMQSIFLDVFKGLKGFKGLSSERTWIYRIAMNKVNDYYRKEYRNKFKTVDIDTIIENEYDDSLFDLQDDLLKSFQSQIVKKCLDNILVQYKIVLILKYIEEKSTKEIASIVDKSPKAIESILHRAKKAFIKLYNDYEVEEEE